MTASITFGSDGYYTVDEVDLSASNDKSIKIHNTASDGKIIYKLGSNNISSSFNVHDSDDNVILSLTAGGNLSTSNVQYFNTTVISMNEAGNMNYMIQDILGTILRRDGNGASRSDTLPSAADIVAAVPHPRVGLSFRFILQNISTGNYTITLLPGSGVIIQNDNVISKNYANEWIVRLDSIDVGNEVVSLYLVGSPYIN